LERQKPAHIHELDGLRGLAALMVFFHHYMIIGASPALGGFGSVRIAVSVAKFGFSGVDVFFVLSGFLITSILLRDKTNPRYYRDFYWKRVLRIMPVYLLHLVYVRMLGADKNMYILLCLLFVANFSFALGVPVEGPAWTLAIEEQFYIFWPQLVRRLSVQTMYMVSLGVVIASMMLRFASELHGSHVFIYTFYRLDGLALGALLACELSGQTPRHEWVRRCLRVLHSKALLWVCGGAAAATMIVWNSHMWMSIYLATTVVLFYRLVRGIVLRKGDPSLRWLRSPVAVYMGAVSYALYMFHGYIFYVYFEHIAPRSRVDLKLFWLGLPITLGISMVVVTISRFALELPVMRLRKYVLR
jgi:peptidoglycan/LPS O-acetylase OafA/YrhL